MGGGGGVNIFKISSIYLDLTQGVGKQKTETENIVKGRAKRLNSILHNINCISL